MCGAVLLTRGFSGLRREINLNFCDARGPVSGARVEPFRWLQGFGKLLESLILAQDERWRRA